MTPGESTRWLRAASPGAPVGQLRIFMGTGVAIEVWPSSSGTPRASGTGEARDAIARAFNWFHLVESACNRFDGASELARLSSTVGAPVSVSPLLFHVLQFALAVAEASDGAFDPTVGDSMIRAGFRHNYRDGTVTVPRGESYSASYRDVILHRSQLAVTLLVPLTLDLGAVAKGFALDLASEELRAFPNHVIAAGGDIISHGAPPGLRSWPIQVRDPLQPDRACRILNIRDAAVCTSGGYFRTRSDGQAGHHLLHGSSGTAATSLSSATVVARNAMLADALATAAFVMGPQKALTLVAEHGAEAMLIDQYSRITETAGLNGARQ